jgi:hypothetical protein
LETHANIALPNVSRNSLSDYEMTLQTARLSNENESAQPKFQIGMAVTLGVGLWYFGT